jgi:hypothetical protein
MPKDKAPDYPFVHQAIDSVGRFPRAPSADDIRARIFRLIDEKKIPPEKILKMLEDSVEEKPARSSRTRTASAKHDQLKS